MGDPFHELLQTHRAAWAYGCGLKPELLARIEQHSRTMADIRSQPNVVILGTASSQSGPVQSVSPARVATDPALLPFPRRAG